MKLCFFCTRNAQNLSIFNGHIEGPICRRWNMGHRRLILLLAIGFFPGCIITCKRLCFNGKKIGIVGHHRPGVKFHKIWGVRLLVLGGLVRLYLSRVSQKQSCLRVRFRLGTGMCVWLSCSIFAGQSLAFLTVFDVFRINPLCILAWSQSHKWWKHRSSNRLDNQSGFSKSRSCKDKICWFGARTDTHTQRISNLEKWFKQKFFILSPITPAYNLKEPLNAEIIANHVAILQSNMKAKNVLSNLPAGICSTSWFQVD